MLLALAIILGVLRTAVILYIVLLWARFVLDWVRVLNRNWRPRGVVLVLAELVYTLTDPPLKLFRRIIPPLRVGAIAIDFAWLITMMLCWILLIFL